LDKKATKPQVIDALMANAAQAKAGLEIQAGPEAAPQAPASQDEALKVIDAAIRRYDERSRPYEGGQGIAVGAENANDRIAADALMSMKRAVRDGKDLDEALKIAITDAHEMVRNHNRKRPKDINWQRWEGTADSILTMTASQAKRAMAGRAQAEPVPESQTPPPQKPATEPETAGQSPAQAVKEVAQPAPQAEPAQASQTAEAAPALPASVTPAQAEAVAEEAAMPYASPLAQFVGEWLGMNASQQSRVDMPQRVIRLAVNQADTEAVMQLVQDVGTKAADGQLLFNTPHQKIYNE
jgi:hypothetical protein